MATTKEALQKQFILHDDGFEYDRFWMIEDFHETPDGCIFRTYDRDGNRIEIPVPDERIMGSRFINIDWSAVICAGFAFRIHQKLGADRVQIWGFYAEDNPDAGVNELADGHDFALVDERYIIDPWLVNVESGNITTPTGETIKLNGQGVFDMQDEDDMKLIMAIYGDSDNWERNLELEREQDGDD